jgi:hypothetical protein
MQQSSIVKVCEWGEGNRGADCSHSAGRISWHWQNPSEFCDWIVFMRLTFCALLKRLSPIFLVRLARRTWLHPRGISPTDAGFLHFHYGMKCRRGGVCWNIHLIETLWFLQRWLHVLHSSVNYSTFRKNQLPSSPVPKNRPSMHQT